jgi:hypothetical protein
VFVLVFVNSKPVASLLDSAFIAFDERMVGGLLKPRSSSAIRMVIKFFTRSS